MLAQLFEQLFKTTDALLITNFFIWVVISVFLFALWCDKRNIHSAERSPHNFPKA